MIDPSYASASEDEEIVVMDNIEGPRMGSGVEIEDSVTLPINN